MRFALPFALLCALSTLSGVALAQDAPRDGNEHQPPPEALAFYQHGRELYRQGHYREAAAELERALMLDPTSPNLVYNVARVHELLGELPSAIRYYERYVALLPNDDQDERDHTLETIRRLRGAQSQVHTPPPPPPGGGEQLRDVGPEVHVENGVADEAFWAVTITAGVTLAAAAIVGGLALSRDADVAAFTADGTTYIEDRQFLVDQVNQLKLATDILFGVSALAALSATFLYFLRSRVVVTRRDAAPPPRDQALLAPFVAPSVGGVVVGLGASL